MSETTYEDRYLKRNTSDVMKQHSIVTLKKWMDNLDYHIGWHPFKGEEATQKELFWKRLRWRIYRAIRRKEGG